MTYSFRVFFSFIASCCLHQSRIVQFVTCFGVSYGRAHSPVGLNMLLFMRRYELFCHREAADLLSGGPGVGKNIVNQYCLQSSSEETLDRGNVLREAAMLRDRELVLSPYSFLCNDDIDFLIKSLAVS